MVSLLHFPSPLKLSRPCHLAGGLALASHPDSSLARRGRARYASACRCATIWSEDEERKCWARIGRPYPHLNLEGAHKLSSKTLGRFPAFSCSSHQTNLKWSPLYLHVDPPFQFPTTSGGRPPCRSLPSPSSCCVCVFRIRAGDGRRGKEDERGVAAARRRRRGGGGRHRRNGRTGRSNILGAR